MCKSWCEAILGIIILIFAIAETSYSKWIVVIAAVMLLIHSFTCKKCFVCMHSGMEMSAKKKKYYSKKAKRG